MEKHWRLSDDQFEERFEKLKFTPSHFTHEAHLRLTWIHLEKYNVEQAVKNICRQIKAMADHLNISQNYHATVTEAAVRALHQRRLQSTTDDFADFLEEFPEIKTDFKSVLSRHYSIDIFKSAEARQHFMAPDLIPFD